MDVSIAMAKLAAIQKSVRAALDEDHYRGTQQQPRKVNIFHVDDVKHYFTQANDLVSALRKELPDWYGDFHELQIVPKTKMSSATGGEYWAYDRELMELLVRDISHVFEIRAHSEKSAPATQVREVPYRVFITHGRANDWREVQAYIEKTLKLNTMELAQEPNAGQTIIEKLEAGSAKCDSAVIVMSGDDLDAAGQTRSRENVMHEIGYFQALYGRKRVVLLHEDGVSVPTNLSGIVYSAYPKGTPSAAFGLLTQELNAMYGR